MPRVITRRENLEIKDSKGNWKDIKEEFINFLNTIDEAQAWRLELIVELNSGNRIELFNKHSNGRHIYPKKELKCT